MNQKVGSTTDEKVILQKITPSIGEQPIEKEIKDIQAKPEPECKSSVIGMHQWRIVENFFEESGGRDVRGYAFYCVHCLVSTTAKITRG